MYIERISVERGAFVIVGETTYDMHPHDPQKPYKTVVKVMMEDVVLAQDAIGGLDDPEDADHLMFMAMETATSGLLDTATLKVIRMYDRLADQAP